LRASPIEIVNIFTQWRHQFRIFRPFTAKVFHLSFDITTPGFVGRSRKVCSVTLNNFM